MTIIYAYSREQALEDGILMTLEDYFLQERTYVFKISFDCLRELPGRFRLGKLFITSNAAALLPPADILKSLMRHHSGEWGDLDAHDKQVNESSLRSRGRLFSAYQTDSGTRFYIITEAGRREATTILLPEDY